MHLNAHTHTRTHKTNPHSFIVRVFPVGVDMASLKSVQNKKLQRKTNIWVLKRHISIFLYLLLQERGGKNNIK